MPAVVVCSTIDHAMSFKGTAEERQFLIEFIEEYIGHSLCYGVWQILSNLQEQEKLTER